MKRGSDFLKIMLCIEPTDMRKQANGLSEMVQNSLDKNPFADCLYLFCNRRRGILTALYFDKAGFCLWTKRLDQSRFPWLRVKDKVVVEINSKDFELIIDGVDVFKRHKKLDFESVS